MVRGEGLTTRRLTAESGVGVGEAVDAVVEEPPLVPAPPTAGVGVVEERVADDAAKEGPLFDAREAAFPLVLANAFVTVAEEIGDPEDGVSVACDPLVIAAVRPETLCATVDVLDDDWT